MHYTKVIPSQLEEFHSKSELELESESLAELESARRI